MPKLKPAKAAVKAEKVIHPESREAKRMARSVLRLNRVTMSKDDHAHRQVDPLVQRVSWFQQHVSTETTQVLEVEMHVLIQAYLRRNDQQLDEIRQEHASRKSRTKAAREDALDARIASETAEYNSGFQAPDLTVHKTLELVKNFSGNKAVLPALRMRSFKKSSAVAVQAEAMLQDIMAHHEQERLAEEQQLAEQQQQQQQQPQELQQQLQYTGSDAPMFDASAVNLGIPPSDESAC
ncbi:hypothetical protein CAOG_07069 [Capsaspora owczarzaki ATCC 30864]|uniref:Translation machinery-associated protein 16 n=1 Tax=Capsaspora owczarzaki (strain ATCC 30864) TaxID=595528 RepID=A0A0D2X4X1_CAPO3|nr:hypothetical protein CAOG_07069 [Capsaspora owczarzaki ATCC 30864]KJE96799.1 hypothetical protein CAOG_007069 [Capsaspora owczarzaki ATCC 30864]|eukprot:XP_004343793.2 hypothetical protein CAOG_07069 [Capsaspora owczarzaki ATCC 30864]